MNEKLLVCWNQLSAGIEEQHIDQLRQSFQDKKIKQLIKSAKSLYKTDQPDSQYTDYSFAVVHDVPLDEDHAIPAPAAGGKIIYEGKGNDYKEFLISLNIMLSLIHSSSEKCIFIIKIAAELKYVNREVGARFIDDLAEEVFEYSRKKK